MILLGCCVVFAALPGCDENTLPTGIDGLPDKDKVDLVLYDTRDTAILMTTSSYYRPVTASSSQILSIGASGSYDSRAVIRWVDLPVGYADGGTIVSARIMLRSLPYTIGDKGAPLSMVVREMTLPWSSYTLTADSIAGLHADPTPRGSFTGVVGDSETVYIPLDTVLVRKWFHIIGQQDALSITGVVIEPAGTGVVRSFSSMEYTHTPQLELIMYDGDSFDTTYVTAYDDTFLARGPVLPPTSFAIQGGMAYRARLSADVSLIPPGSIINNVRLYLCKDTAGSVTYYRGNDSVRIYEAYDMVKDTMTTPAEALLSTTDYTLGRFVIQGAALIRAVQHWVDNPAANHGLILQKYGESSDIDRIALRGAEAPMETRPRFVITYTKRQ